MKMGGSTRRQKYCQTNHFISNLAVDRSAPIGVTFFWQYDKLTNQPTDGHEDSQVTLPKIESPATNATLWLQSLYFFYLNGISYRYFFYLNGIL